MPSLLRVSEIGGALVCGRTVRHSSLYDEMTSAGVSILETVGRAALRELGADVLKLSRWWMGKRDIRTRRGKVCVVRVCKGDRF